jgi:hypothetical protein
MIADEISEEYGFMDNQEEILDELLREESVNF